MSKLYVDNIASKTGGTDALSIDSSGRVSVGKPVGFGVIKASNQTIAGTGVKVENFSTTANIYGGFNTDGAGGTMLNLSSGIVTIPVNGYYQFNATMRIDNFAGAYHFLDFEKTDSSGTYTGSGSARISRSLESATASDYTELQVMGLNYLQQGDYAALYWANSGDNNVVIHENSYFSMFKVG